MRKHAPFARSCLLGIYECEGLALERANSHDLHVILMRIGLVFILAIFIEPASGFRAAAPPSHRPVVRRAPAAPRSAAIECSAPQQQATLAASVLGLASQPIMWWSLFTLKTTGCGLPAGPFGLIGAAEGIS